MRRTFTISYCSVTAYPSWMRTINAQTVTASGTITLDCAPLDGASIPLLNENGVTAIAKSDSNGRFGFRFELSWCGYG